MSYLAGRWALFREPGFGLQVLSCLVTNIGFGMAFVAMTWIVVSYSESVAAVALLMACFWLPNVLLSPFLGVIVDRYDRSGIVTLSNLARGLVLIAVTILYINTNNIELIYLLALVTGAFSALYMPAAFALVRELVPEKKLLYANATVDMAYEAGFVIGAASSGFIIAYASSAYCLIINGGLFILAAVCVLLIQVRPELKYIPEMRNSGIWQSFKEDLNAGFAYLAKRPTLKMLYAIQLLVFAEFQSAPILLSPFVKVVLEGEVHDYGIIEAALSIGLLIGGMILPYLAARYERQVIIWANAASVVGFAIFAFVGSIASALVVYGFLGICMSVWAVIMTRAQAQTDMAFQGRLTSLFFSLGSLVTLLLYFLITVGGLYLNIRGIFIFEVLIAAIATGLSWYMFKQYPYDSELEDSEEDVDIESDHMIGNL